MCRKSFFWFFFEFCMALLVMFCMPLLIPFYALLNGR